MWLEVFVIAPLKAVRFVFHHLWPFPMHLFDRHSCRRNHACLRQDVLDSFSYLFVGEHTIEHPDVEQAVGHGFDYAEVVVGLPQFRLTVRRCRGEVAVFLAPIGLPTEGDELSDLLSLCEAEGKPAREHFSDLRQASSRLQDRLGCIASLLSGENYPAVQQRLYGR